MRTHFLKNLQTRQVRPLGQESPLGKEERGEGRPGASAGSEGKEAGSVNKMPVMPAQCKTCPFREDGWVELQPLLQHRALNEATPICHSTGKALTKRLGPSRLCRGARDFQIMIFHRLGVIEAPTDEAWQKKCEEMGL